MSTHTVHPDIHTHGLADGCPRCEEIASNPLASLDTENLNLLLGRMTTSLPPRSANEWLAMQRIEAAGAGARVLLERLERSA